jgi:outer membrane protein assembly factor BamB
MRIVSFVFSCFIVTICYGQQDFNALPREAWKFKTGRPVYASAVILGQTVYVGSCDSNLYAIHLETGNIKWKFRTKGEIRSAVAVHGDKIFLLSGDGAVYCLHKESGKLVWTFRTNGEKKYPLFSFSDYYYSSPVYENGMIYFGSGDQNIYALNAITGKLAWKFKTGSIVHTTAAVQDGKVYIGSFDGYFYCLNSANGKLVWKFKTVGQTYFPKGEINGSANFFQDKIYFGARDFNFYALDQEHGFCHWNLRFQRGWAVTKPAFKDSVLFIGTSDDHLLLALDPGNGRTLWKADLQYNIFAEPTFSDSMLYVGTLMGKLFAIQRRNGNIAWAYNTTGYSQNHLNYFKVDDTYRDDFFGSILKKNEDFLDLYVNMGAIFSKPAIWSDYIVFTSLDGTVYCLKKI